MGKADSPRRCFGASSPFMMSNWRLVEGRRSSWQLKWWFRSQYDYLRAEREIECREMGEWKGEVKAAAFKKEEGA